MLKKKRLIKKGKEGSFKKEKKWNKKTIGRRKKDIYFHWFLKKT